MIRSIKGYDVYVYKNGTVGFYGFISGLNGKSRQLVKKAMNLQSFIETVSEDRVVRFFTQDQSIVVTLYPCQRPADVVNTNMHAFTGDAL